MTPIAGPTVRLISAMSSTVAPDLLKPVEVLTKVSARRLRQLACKNFLRIREQGCFDDHLHECASLVGGIHDAADIRLHYARFATPKGAYVDHHINFFRAVRESGPRLGYFSRTAGRTERKPDYSTDFHDRTLQFRSH